MAKTCFCAPHLFSRKRSKPAPAQQEVEKMGGGEASSKLVKADISSKTEGSQGVKKPDKGGLGQQPLYQPKDGEEANVEYACRCIPERLPQ